MSEPKIDASGLILHAKLTEVTVCVLPESNVNHSAYAVTVSYRGDELYAVMHRGFCLGANGAWEYEPQPSSRTDRWIKSHRFDYDKAYRLACEVAPTVECNGRSAAEAAGLPTEPRSREAMSTCISRDGEFGDHTVNDVFETESEFELLLAVGPLTEVVNTDGG